MTDWRITIFRILVYDGLAMTMDTVSDGERGKSDWDGERGWVGVRVAGWGWSAGLVLGAVATVVIIPNGSVLDWEARTIKTERKLRRVVCERRAGVEAG